MLYFCNSKIAIHLLQKFIKWEVKKKSKNVGIHMKISRL